VDPARVRFAVGITLILIVLGVMAYRILRMVQRWRALARFASSNGLSFTRSDPFGMLELGFNQFQAGGGLARVSGAFGGSPTDVFRAAGMAIRLLGMLSGTPLQNVVSGVWKGVAVKAADQSVAVRGPIWLFTGLPRRRRYSVAIADLDVQVPKLAIRRERWRDRVSTEDDVDFEVEEFNRRFRVTCGDRAFAYKLVDALLIDWLIRGDDRYGFEVLGGKLLVSCSRLRPSELPGLLDAAAGFHQRIPRLVRAQYGAGAPR
jgi:hypothetical protein